MQSGGLLKDLTVGETVRMTASFFAHTRPAGEVLARAGIADIADRRVGKCSGGQQQRLRFAMALLPDPDLMVLDEPTTGMDVEGRRDFWSAIRADARAGRTILFATHYLDEADAYADRIVLISRGEVVADATPDGGRGPGGHGLRGLRERAQQAGAQLSVGRADRRGFRLRVSVPGGAG